MESRSLVVNSFSLYQFIFHFYSNSLSDDDDESIIEKKLKLEKNYTSLHKII